MRVDVGSLVDVIARSDLIVAGVVAPPTPGSKSSTIQVGVVLYGESARETLTFVCKAKFEAGARQVFFLRRNGDSFECVQRAGAVYPATSEDDRLYRRIFEIIRPAFVQPEAQRIAAIRNGLILGLEARVAELRYHSLLDLLATIHPEHPLTAGERERLRGLMGKADFDPALRDMLQSRLAAMPTAAPDK